MPIPASLSKAERKLKRLHRRVSRKVKRDVYRKKTIKRLAKGYLKVGRQRKDFAVKTARALIQSSDLVAYEDLKITHLVKNHRLAKSISDASWGLFLSWVRYYGQVHGIPVIAVPARFTTQDCSGCGKRVKKTLSIRTHICPRCGLVLDRDWNAALNILLAALAWVAAHRTAGQAETGRGSRAAQRFWTEDHKPAQAIVSRQVGWMKEESPGASFGECQIVTCFTKTHEPACTV